MQVLKPQPRITPLNEPFWAGCNEGVLMIQRCGACGQHVFYPRVCCPFCHEDKLSWIQASGRGNVISHTTIRRTHHDGFNAEAPYVFAAIAMEEGPYIYAQMPGAPVDAASMIGRPVNVKFVPHGPSQKIPVFTLEGGAK